MGLHLYYNIVAREGQEILIDWCPYYIVLWSWFYLVVSG